MLKSNLLSYRLLHIISTAANTENFYIKSDSCADDIIVTRICSSGSYADAYSMVFKQAPGGSWETLSVMLLDIISLFAVPLFMFISGYLFISRHSHADKYGIGFCRKMFLSVLSPYLLFSLMYIIGACWVNNDKYSLDEIITMIITGSAAVHLGFFRALFGFIFFIL